MLENKYKKAYDAIIRNAVDSKRDKTDGYYERHHIIPKSCGGTNDNDNLVLLTAREHYLCHKLLTKFTIGETQKKMFFAMWAFNRSSKNQNRIVISSRDYEYVRTYLSKKLSEERTGLPGRKLTEEQRQKISKSTKGKKKSEETKNRMKESWKNRPPRTKEHCEALSKSIKGRLLGDETKKKMSEAKKGKNPVHTQISWSCPHCDKSGIGISNYNRWHGENCKAHEHKIRTR